LKIIYTITRMVIGGAQETAKHTAEYFHDKGHDVLFVTGAESGRE
jgi:flagellar biosynthesis/type III secretory pathway ATPase